MDESPSVELGPDVKDFVLLHRRVFVLSRRRDGWPDIHPMSGEWRDGAVWVNTYRKSQKVVNLERDPRGSYLITSDDDEAEFGAVNIRGTAFVVESIPGTPGDQRTGFERPLRPGEVARRVRLKLTPTAIDRVR